MPCGIEGKGVTSLSKELNRNMSIEEVLPEFVDSFCKTFECDSVEIEREEANRILEHLEAKFNDKVQSVKNLYN